MHNPVLILYLEDSPRDAELVRNNPPAGRYVFEKPFIGAALAQHVRAALDEQPRLPSS